MANANKPMGLSPHSYLNGAKWNMGGTWYAIPTSDTTNAYAIGDPVSLAGSSDALGIPTIVLATAGDAHTLVGAVVGLSSSVPTYGGALGAGGNQFASTVIAAGTRTNTVYALVADDPMILFEVQEVSGGTQLAAADLAININLLAGTNNGYASGWLLDNASKSASTTTYQCQLLRLVQRADNTFGAYAKWLVRINNHAFKVGNAGV